MCCDDKCQVLRRARHRFRETHLYRVHTPLVVNVHFVPGGMNVGIHQLKVGFGRKRGRVTHSSEGHVVGPGAGAWHDDQSLDFPSDSRYPPKRARLDLYIHVLLCEIDTPIRQFRLSLIGDEVDRLGRVGGNEGGHVL